MGQVFDIRPARLPRLRRFASRIPQAHNDTSDPIVNLFHSFTTNVIASRAEGGTRQSRINLSPLVVFNLALLLLFPALCFAENLSAKAVAEKTEVSVGEPFLYQIQIQGDDTPREPAFPKLNDFTVEFLGGQQNSSTAVSIINGRMTQNVHRGFVYSYRLTPNKAGNLLIPSVSIPSGNKAVQTQAMRISVSRPEESEDFHLKLSLSSLTAYVGEPITLTVTWYIGKDVEEYAFNLPVLTDKRFDIVDLNSTVNPQQQSQHFRLQVGSKEVIAKKGRKSLDGKSYMAVTFKKVLIPKVSGTITLPQSTVSCNALVGYKQRQQNYHDPFDAFFQDDFFFGRRQEAVYKRFIVPSNEPALFVKELPTEGKPKGFNGLVGKYSITASAIPTDVRVGDPITLIIRVTGPEYLGNVELPPLHLQPELAGDFKIPEEMAAGDIEGRVVNFTQTFRVKHAGVKEIPEIRLPYFDTKEKSYGVARTQSIPLNVSAARIVTADDAEGPKGQVKTTTELENWTSGIMANYEDASALQNQAVLRSGVFASSSWLMLLLGPPLGYAALFFGAMAVRKKQADPEKRKARRAHTVLETKLRKLQRASSESVFSEAPQAFREFIASKLGLSAGALTYSDVENELTKRDIAIDPALKEFFSACEASRYAGQVGAGMGPMEMLEQARSLAKNLERSVK